MKYLGRGYRPVHEVLEEIGIVSPTFFEWRDQFENVLHIKKINKTAK
jgi:hypothetical protein